LARLAVGDRISHSLLRYSKQAQCGVVADPAQVPFGCERYLDAVLLFDFETVRVESASETYVAQCAGVEVVRQPTDTVDQPESPPLKHGHRLLGGDFLNVPSPPFQVAHRD